MTPAVSSVKLEWFPSKWVIQWRIAGDFDYICTLKLVLIAHGERKFDTGVEISPQTDRQVQRRGCESIAMACKLTPEPPGLQSFKLPSRCPEVRRSDMAQLQLWCPGTVHSAIQSMMVGDILRPEHRCLRETSCVSRPSPDSFFQPIGAPSQNFFLPIFDKHSTLFMFGQFTSMGRPIKMRSEGAKTSGGDWGQRFETFLYSPR
jgi:hypothetical protein